MKIILQSEVRTISNYQIAKNQQELFELLNKPHNFTLGLFNRVKAIAIKKSGDRSL